MTAIRAWSPLAPLALALAALVFGLDQSHKWWMLHVYGITGQPIAVLPFLDLVLTWNRGISYGLFRTPLQAVLIAVSLAISGLLWLWLCRSRNALTVAALAIVIGGALSNAFDRVVHGAVADFFHFHVGEFSWYVFNLADVAIVAGVVLLLYESFTERRSG